MIAHALKPLFDTYLQQLLHELLAYRKEEHIWRTEGAIANSAGNLSLHLVGNLKAFIGVPFAGIHYVRNRELEFSLRDVPRAELVADIDDTLQIVTGAMDLITEEQVLLPYPIPTPTNSPNTGAFLAHLACHLCYHVGQINYHRRLLD